MPPAPPHPRGACPAPATGWLAPTLTANDLTGARRADAGANRAPTGICPMPMASSMVQWLTATPRGNERSSERLRWNTSPRREHAMGWRQTRSRDRRQGRLSHLHAPEALESRRAFSISPVALPGAAFEPAWLGSTASTALRDAALPMAAPGPMAGGRRSPSSPPTTARTLPPIWRRSTPRSGSPRRHPSKRSTRPAARRCQSSTPPGRPRPASMSNGRMRSPPGPRSSWSRPGATPRPTCSRPSNTPARRPASWQCR